MRRMKGCVAPAVALEDTDVLLFGPETVRPLFEAGPLEEPGNQTRCTRHIQGY